MKIIAVILGSLLIVACATPPKEIPPQASKTVDKPPATVSNPVVITDLAEIEAKKLAARIQELQKQSIYFHFGLLFETILG